MQCQWFLDILTIAISAIIFAQTLGQIVFRWFFQFQNQCLGMIFCGKPKNNGLYDMLKFATNCAFISALEAKGEKFTVSEQKLWSSSFCAISLKQCIDSSFTCHIMESLRLNRRRKGGIEVEVTYCNCVYFALLLYICIGIAYVSWYIQMIFHASIAWSLIRCL